MTAATPTDVMLIRSSARRHLNESQRAMIAARMATLHSGARTDLASIDARSQIEAAALLNVSRPSVQRAKRVLELVGEIGAQR